MDWPKVPFDQDGYIESVTSDGSCFVCELVRSDPPTHEVVFRDAHHIVFLNRYPTMPGYVLVAPVEHRERVVEDFTESEYLELQSLIWRLGRAMAEVTPTERIYLLSLGSQQGNSHVHWHVTCLPPGVPYPDQQFAALMAEDGYLDVPAAERARFAAGVAEAMVRVGSL
ncbi:MAG TPA: HIT family protein [Acidimicrobiales bacterium]|nr:HIT family protein [Acidimicrobiales bacterium]